MVTTKARSLESRASRSAVRALLLVGGALFVSAGTLAYWQAWVILTLQIGSTVATNAYLLRRDRELLRRRLAMEERGESQPVQKLFFALFTLLGVSMFVVAGLDRRFGWSDVPLPVQIAAVFAVVACTYGVFLVFRENTFASSVIELEAQQRVVSTGPYRLVRHPMYTGILLAFAATPLALGSYCAEVFFLPLCAIFVMRLLAEERFLRDGLPGYASYMQVTRKRLVPGLW